MSTVNEKDSQYIDTVKRMNSKEDMMLQSIKKQCNSTTLKHEIGRASENLPTLLHYELPSGLHVYKMMGSPSVEREEGGGFKYISDTSKMYVVNEEIADLAYKIDGYNVSGFEIEESLTQPYLTYYSQATKPRAGEETKSMQVVYNLPDFDIWSQEEMVSGMGEPYDKDTAYARVVQKTENGRILIGDKVDSEDKSLLDLAQRTIEEAGIEMPDAEAFIEKLGVEMERATEKAKAQEGIAALENKEEQISALESKETEVYQDRQNENDLEQ